MCEECGMAYSFVFEAQPHKADCPTVQSRIKAYSLCPICGDTMDRCPEGGKNS